MLDLGLTIRNIRKEKGLSLDETSRLTSVSKAMIGQIERGESNPTISTLWKLSTGLKVPLSRLIGTYEKVEEVNDILDSTPVQGSNDKMKLYDVFSFDPLVGFEYFYITIEPGGMSKSQPHNNGAKEYVVVTEGTLTLEVQGERKILKAPSSISFTADVPHTYMNEGKARVVFQNIVKY